MNANNVRDLLEPGLFAIDKRLGMEIDYSDGSLDVTLNGRKAKLYTAEQIRDFAIGQPGCIDDIRRVRDSLDVR
jgi:hypothetical protein